jgi:hypothetical protein
MPRLHGIVERIVGNGNEAGWDAAFMPLHRPQAIER